MDPASAVGIAAASLQFAGVTVKGVLGGIGLLKSLKETPVRLTELLRDVDKSVARIIHLQQTIQGPDSGWVRRLSHVQLLALRATVDDAYQAMVRLQVTLEPLFGNQNAETQTRAKRMWRSVVSLKMERDIEEKLETIQRHNDQIVRELQLSGLDIQIQLSDTLEKTLAAVEQSRSEAETRFDRLETHTEDVHRESSNVKSNITQVLICSTSTTAQLNAIRSRVEELGTKIDQLGASSQEAHIRVDNLCDRITSTQSNVASQLELTVRHESSATREEIIALRNAIILAMTGKQPGLSSVDLAVIVRLSDADKADLEAQLRLELMSRPSALRDTCDFLMLRDNLSSALFQPSQQCRGRAKWKGKSVRRGLLSFNYETRGRHEPTCPQSWSSIQSCKYQIAIPLLPFLNKTIELTFRATFQGGGFQIEFPLTVFATVKRSESCIFQLFELFPDRCGARFRCAKWSSYMWRLQGEGERSYQLIFGYEWDIEDARQQLRQSYQFLLEASMRGVGSISDKDEYGHTILQEIITLIGLLAPVYADLTGEIDALLLLAERYGIDLDAVANSKKGSRRHSSLEMFGWNSFQPNDLKNWTVADAARDCVKMFNSELRGFSFLNRLARFCSIDFERDLQQPVAGDMEDWASQWVEKAGLHTNVKSSILRTLRREPWLSRYFFEGSLAWIILNGKLDHLRQALPTLDLEAESFGCLPLNALDLAIGWPDGLRLLSTVWTNSISGTIELASYNCERESLRVLCEFSVPLFKDIPESLSFMRALVMYGTHHILVHALKQRRDSLTELAHEYLSTGDQARFGLLDKRTLDAKACLVYDLLKERSIPVPAGLNPGPAGSVYSLAAKTYLVHSSEVDFSDMVRTLRDLFISGFRDIDEGDGNAVLSCTPLESILGRGHNGDEDWVPISLWFLRMGASPTFHSPDTANNILFGVARSLSSYSEERYMENFTSTHMTRLVEYAAALFSSLETDQCTCFCSSKGCLPLHYILRVDDLLWTNGRCNSHRGYRTFSWMKSCGLEGDDEELYLEESVRLELFNRLGMAHTCCTGRRPMSNSEIRRIREDDSELKAQLDLLMMAYRNSRRTWPKPPEGCKFITHLVCRCWDSKDRWGKYIEADYLACWEWWWYKAKQILPDILSHKRIWIQPTEKQVSEMEAVVLRRMSYDGLDFTEVIRRHFAGDLILKQPSLDSEGTEIDLANCGKVIPEDDGPGESDARIGQSVGKVFIPRKRMELLEAALYEDEYWAEFFADEFLEWFPSEEHSGESDHHIEEAIEDVGEAYDA